MSEIAIPSTLNSIANSIADMLVLVASGGVECGAAEVSQQTRGRERLSATFCRQTRTPGRHHDGGGLYLHVDEKGNKRWDLRLTLSGRQAWRGLGAFPDTSLAEARQMAQERRKAARQGVDSRSRANPSAATLGASGPMTFRQAFDRHFEEHVRASLHPDYAVEYVTAVEQYLMGAIGDIPVGEVEPRHIVDALREPWSKASDRSRRVAQRAARVFQWAIAMGERTMAEPCGPAREVLGRGRGKTEHRRAIHWKDAPAFLRWVRDRSMAWPSTALCLEMILLTGLRSWEARAGRWQEIQGNDWLIPGVDPVLSKELGHEQKRMKRGVAHLAPLSAAALDVLGRASLLRQSLSPAALLFPSPTGKILSDNTLGKLMRDGGIAGTPHGLRSTLRDWAADHGYRHEVCEALLAHGAGDQTVAAYARSTFLSERREIAEAWGRYLLAPI